MLLILVLVLPLLLLMLLRAGYLVLWWFTLATCCEVAREALLLAAETISGMHSAQKSRTYEVADAMTGEMLQVKSKSRKGWDLSAALDVVAVAEFEAVARVQAGWHTALLLTLCTFVSAFAAAAAYLKLEAESNLEGRGAWPASSLCAYVAWAMPPLILAAMYPCTRIASAAAVLQDEARALPLFLRESHGRGEDKVTMLVPGVEALQRYVDGAFTRGKLSLRLQGWELSPQGIGAVAALVLSLAPAMILFLRTG